MGHRQARGVLLFVTLLATAGCGLLIGLEDRELPALPGDTGVPDGATDGPLVTDSMTGTDATPIVDGGDAGVDAADSAVCTCAAGCNPYGECVDEIVSIASGRQHQCVLKGDGRLFCIGGNTFGQIAQTDVPDFTEAWRPVVVNDQGQSLKFRAVAAGNLTTCAITRDNDIWCWGNNSYFQLGQPTGASSAVPAKVNLGALKAKSVHVGNITTCAIVDTAGPNVRCWGHGAGGELGINVDPSDGGAGPDGIAQPQVVGTLRATSLHVGDSDGNQGTRVCAIAEGGTPMCWGAAENHEITTPITGLPRCDPNGLGSYACVLAPTAWDTGTATTIVNGIYDVCALQPAVAGGANRIRCRTATNAHTLKDDCNPVFGIFEVTPPMGVTPVRLVAATGAKCFTSAANEVYCFGSNGASQLGRPGSDKCGAAPNGGSNRRPAEPVAVQLAGVTIKAKLVTMGTFGGLVYTTDKKLVGWGANHAGQLGPRPAPVISIDCEGALGGYCEAPKELPALPP